MQQRAQQTLRQEAIDKSAMTSAKTLLEVVLEAYNRNLDLAGARSLAAVSGQFLDTVRESSKTSAAGLLWAQSLDDEADLYAILGNNMQSLAVAKRAKDVA
jgi:hypothetical protein